MPMHAVEQTELLMPTRGGRRKGAGRKRVAPRPTVAHVRRPVCSPAHPVQVTLRVGAGVPSLRERAPWAVVVRVMRAVRASVAGFRVIHYSVMTNHLHLVVEADAPEYFATGMRALTTRLALRLNRLFGRTGRLVEHRFHTRELTTPREVRESLKYVLCNARKHALRYGPALPAGWIDPRSSAAVFDGWIAVPARHHGDYGTSPAKTWLLRVGWRRWGPIGVDDVPGQRSARTIVAANDGLREVSAA
jgi:REP element-mobilizing transposase RayT